MSEKTTKIAGGSDRLDELVSHDELKLICDLTEKLTQIRQRGCKHLCVENFAQEMMHKLMTSLALFKCGVALDEIGRPREFKALLKMLKKSG